MEVQEYLDKMNEIQTLLLEYIDEEDNIIHFLKEGKTKYYLNSEIYNFFLIKKSFSSFCKKKY